MVGVSINLRPELLEQIDEAKGPQSRSSFIVQAVYEFLNPIKADWEADRTQLIAQAEADKGQLEAQIEALKDTQRRLEDEKRRLEDDISYLKDQNSRMLDAVAQKLLTQPKKHWWSFRKKE